MRLKYLLFFIILFSTLNAFYPFKVSIIENSTLIPENRKNFYLTNIFSQGNVIYVIDEHTSSLYKLEEEFLRLSMDLDTPTGLWIDNETIYIADRGKGLIKKIFSSSKVIFSYEKPYGVAKGNEEIFYMTLKKDGKIVIFNFKEDVHRYFGSKGSFKNQFLNPTDLHFFNNTLFIVDSGNNRVEAYKVKDYNLSYLRSYGRGIGNIELENPQGIFVDENYVYVTDKNNNRVVFFTHDGYPIFVLNVTAPIDITKINNSLFITYSEGILRITISINPPEKEVSLLIKEIESDVKRYKEICEVALKLNIKCNYTLLLNFDSALFAKESKYYGEAFYKLSSIKEAKPSLLLTLISNEIRDKIKELSKNTPNKKEILRLVDEGKFKEALNLLNQAEEKISNNSEESDIQKDKISNETLNLTTNNFSDFNKNFSEEIEEFEKDLKRFEEILKKENITLGLYQYILAELQKAKSLNKNISQLKSIFQLIKKEYEKEKEIKEKANLSLQKLREELNKNEWFINKEEAKKILSEGERAFSEGNYERAFYLSKIGKNELEVERERFYKKLWMFVSFIFALLGAILVIYNKPKWRNPL